MYSEEAEKREEERKAREAEQEDVALSLGDTKERVKKYDRIKKKTRTKVFCPVRELIHGIPLLRAGHKRQKAAQLSRKDFGSEQACGTEGGKARTPTARGSRVGILEMRRVVRNWDDLRLQVLGSRRNGTNSQIHTRKHCCRGTHR